MFVEEGDGHRGAAALGVAGEERGKVIGMVEIQGKAWAGRDAESKPLALGLLAMGLGAAHSEARDKGAGEGKGEAIRARAVLISGEARALRDEGFGALLTYSKKLFIPLTHLCRDVCHYCTFATTPRHQQAPYMSVEAVLDAARQGAAAGCKEALFTLGEKPELRYRAAREALATLGFPSTTAYLAHVAERVLSETGLLPHLNPGTLSDEEFRALKPVGPSMGMMLESTSLRLCEKGMPHYGSPDKDPAVRIATLDAAGRAAVPFTTGLLIGIGETRRERIETLLAIRASPAPSAMGSTRAVTAGSSQRG